MELVEMKKQIEERMQRFETFRLQVNGVRDLLRKQETYSREIETIRRVRTSRKVEALQADMEESDKELKRIHHILEQRIKQTIEVQNKH